VSVTGERAAEMLNGLVSQDVRQLSGAGRPALLLNVKGRVLADLRVFPTSDGLLLDVPAAGLEKVLATFKKYLPPLYAKYEDLGVAHRHVGTYGPQAAELVGSVLEVAPPEPELGCLETMLAGSPVLVVRNRRLGVDGVELIGPDETLAGLWGELEAGVVRAGGRAVGGRALEVVRVEAGVPRYGTDMGEDNLAQEPGLEEALSFEKGCYLGQEVVARIHFRGHVNRHLRGLEFEDGPPEPGARLLRGEKEVGRVTSAVRSPDLGPIGLGYVRREVEPPETVRWADDDGSEGAVSVVELPLRRSFEVGQGAS
jgi:folate-binding protein YgfZ